MISINRIYKSLSVIVLSGIVFSLLACTGHETNEFVQQQHLKVTYSKNSKQKAKTYALLVSEALNYYDSTLKPGQDTYILYVLSPEDYKQIENKRHVPYGMPYMSGNNIYMPSEKGIVYNQIVKAFTLGGTSLSGKEKQQRSRLAETGIDLISLHELGHTCQGRLDLWQNERWKNECLANYYMLLFLKNRKPGKYNQMIQFCSLNCKSITPAWKSLKKFEEKYDSDPATYSWFQSKFTLMVKDYLENHESIIENTDESRNFTDYIRQRWEMQVLGES